MNPRVWSFDEIPINELEPMIPRIGNKAASLVEMREAGLPVPPGFVISSECCTPVLRGAWPEGLEKEVREKLAALEEKTGKRYAKGADALLVSIRSGAAVPMPGMMATLLNCGAHPGLADDVGDTPGFWRLMERYVVDHARVVNAIVLKTSEDPDRESVEQLIELHDTKAPRPFPRDPRRALVEGITAVFRSWDSRRARAYRERNSLQGLAGTAVTVQAMFPSEVSGVLFTKDPNDAYAPNMIIESTWGLGEAVVTGDVTPDRFLVDRETLRLRDATLGNKVSYATALGSDTRIRHANLPSLTEALILELSRVACRIEGHFRKPVDIEWGLAKQKFSILQVRPIRALEDQDELEELRQREISRLHAMANGNRRAWVIHNLGEAIRTPTPLTWDILSRFMSGSGGFGLMIRDLGYRPSARVRRDGFLDLIGGRIYADLERAAGLFWDGLPTGYDPRRLAREGRGLERPPQRLDLERVNALFLLGLPGLLLAMFRGARTLGRARRRARENFEASLVPYREYVERERARDLSKLPVSGLLKELEARRVRVFDTFGRECLKPGFLGGIALDSLATLLGRVVGTEEGARLAGILLLGLEGDMTFEQSALLYRVARGEASKEDFLDRFGHRAVREMELAQPRWSEDPGAVEALLAPLKARPTRSPLQIQATNKARREEAEKELPDILEHWGGSSLRGEIGRLLDEARTLLPYRETGRHYLMMGAALVRDILVELGRRWEVGGDLFFFTLDELKEFETRGDELRMEIEDRRRAWKMLQRLQAPDLLESSNLHALGETPVLETTSRVRGDAVAPGVTLGPAIVAREPGGVPPDAHEFILVCPSADPGWTPLFLRSRGLVVERGGILSHAGIVARDFGIPAVVCRDATRIIRTGDMLRVDGNGGNVDRKELDSHD